MEERDEITQKTIRKIVIPKVVTTLFIVDIIFLVFMFTLSGLVKFMMSTAPDEQNYNYIIINVIGLTVLIDIFAGIFLYSLYKDRLLAKMSEKYVKDVLSPDVYVQVSPIYAPPGYKTFITEVLPNHVDGFFAILDEEKQKVKIVLKFPNDDEYSDYTYTEYKYFPSEYIIIDNSEKLNNEKVNEELMLKENINADYQKITAKKVAAENGIEYIPKAIGQKVKRRGIGKNRIYAVKDKYILLYPANNEEFSEPIEWYGSLNDNPFLILDNQSSFKEITNLSDILLQMVKLYAKYIDEDLFIASTSFAIKLEDNVCPGYCGRASLVLTEDSIRNKKVKPQDVIEAKKYFINDFLDHYIGWNFGVAVKSNPTLEQELINLNDLVISKGLREPADSGFHLMSEDVVPYELKQA